MKKLLIILTAGSLFVGCATTYHKKNLLFGGYYEQQILEDIYIVGFDANMFTSGLKIESYIEYRCAEIAFNNGFNYITIEDIEIEQSETTTINIPNTGTANILLPSKGYGGIYRFKGNLWEQVYNFNENTQRINLHLLPGNYKVVFRSRAAKQYMYTREKDFKVRSGKSELIKLY